MNTFTLIAFAAVSCCAAPLAAQRNAPRDASTIVNGPVGARVDSALRSLEARGMSGVFLVRADGAVLVQKGYGLANRSPRTPFTPDIVTQIGSCTKDFTAVAIFQLAERGKLSLDDTITRWFPDAPTDKRAITVAQLLDHTAGFKQYSGGDFDPVTREQFIARMMTSALRSTPGAEEHYSNPGYGLLAVIVEMVSSQSYDEYLRDNILAPLGLTHTGFLLPKFDPARVSHGYNAGGDNGIIIEKAHAPDGPWWNLRGNGGMLSTVGDMQTFYGALFDGEKLVSYAARRGRYAPSEATGLSGSDMTHFFLYERDPRRRTSLIIATNNADYQGPTVRVPIETALGNGPAATPAASVSAPVATLPDSPAGAAFARYVTAFNSGDTTKMIALFSDHFAPSPQSPSIAQRIANYKRFFANVGAIVPLSVSSMDANSIAVVAHNKDGDTITLEMRVEPSGSHRILGVRITAQ